MCLEIPGVISEVNGKEVVVDYGFEKRKAINLIKAKLGDYVIVKEKFVILKLNKKDARNFLKSIKNAG